MLDVRTRVEHNEARVAGARLMPLDELQPAKIVEWAAGRPVHVLCKTGGRARKAAAKLEEAKVPEVAVIEGGIEAWIAAGLPVERGVKTMSLERQVRIAAGALVLAGVGLGFLLHPAFFALSGFVGCGLVFAGVTDWCGMGLLLAKMPWNKGSCKS